MDYKKALKFYPDFPIEGVNFVDIIPLMQDKALFTSLIDDLGALCASGNIVAPEARGFLFAAPMLCRCDHVYNVIPMRKKGKLPHAEGDLVGVDIVKEYGKDQIYFRLSDVAVGHPDGDTFRVTFFDDVLATGGTALGIAEGLEKNTVAKWSEWTQALVISPRAGVELFECLRMSVQYQWYLNNAYTFSHVSFGISWAFHTMGGGRRPMRR